jgi:tRNA A37 threonylcarbamoyladenosine synthetase subunit TsaC/SUA5/YrdC
MKIVALAVLAAVSLAPAALAQTAAPATAAAAAKFNLDTQIQAIVADEKGKAALESAVPGLSTHESFDMFKGMSLNQLAGYAGDQLTPEVLAKAQKALAEVK